jgi:hypothetical protein
MQLHAVRIVILYVVLWQQLLLLLISLKIFILLVLVDKLIGLSNKSLLLGYGLGLGHPVRWLVESSPLFLHPRALLAEFFRNQLLCL